MEIMDNCEDMVTINDLKEDELRIIFKTLSVRQLVRCLRVCKRWQSIIRDILSTRLTLTFLYNDIHLFTLEEKQNMCSYLRHTPFDSSIGSILGQTSPFLPIHILKHKDKLQKIFSLCPNIQSLNLKYFAVQTEDINFIIANCPQLECLYIRCENFLYEKLVGLKGLKHLSISSPQINDLSNILIQFPLIEELVIIDAIFYPLIDELFCSSLKKINCHLNKFHFSPQFKISDEIVLHIIEALCDDTTNKSNIKDLNIEVVAFPQMIDEINKRFYKLKTLSLLFDNDHIFSMSLRKLKINELNINFDSIAHQFQIEAINDLNKNDIQYLTLISHLNMSVKKMSITKSVLSLNAFKETLLYVPYLKRINFCFVNIDASSEKFWKLIAEFKHLRYLIINNTNISDNGCHALENSNSLNSLELIKCNRHNASAKISAHLVIDVFSKLAIRHSSKWLTLYLDVDEFVVNDQIKNSVPRNVRLLNIGWKK